VPQRLGQHFLIRGSILERIAAAACPRHEPLVVEIGPGRGALTDKLVPRADRVIAVELDAYLAGLLRSRSTAEIIEADVLDTDLAQWGRPVIAGNLPYYITSPILEKVLRLDFIRAVFLVQKEVADRLAAQPGSRDYGYLTVQTAVFSHACKLFEVKPSAFHPPPKVDSAVVLLEPHPPAVADPEAFLRFAGLCFRHKRKTIRNNLAETYGKALIDAWPEASQRAEQLTLNQFIGMYARTL
jgi:16S rRNA (adenine1518-N6/adenine1519-N6)-dimethyltransferase